MLPGVMAGFRGDGAVGLEIEFLPFGDSAEFWPFDTGRRSVFNRGRAASAALSSASGGDLVGKFMTCSRKGTE